jgi:hypothetical protein
VSIVSSSSRTNDSSGVAGNADLGARPAGDRLVEPHLLDEGRVLHKAQEGGPRGHQPAARLLLGQSVQAGVEAAAVLVQERLELRPGRLVDDVLGGRRGQG